MLLQMQIQPVPKQKIKLRNNKEKTYGCLKSSPLKYTIHFVNMKKQQPLKQMTDVIQALFNIFQSIMQDKEEFVNEACESPGRRTTGMNVGE